jgi:ABC-type proline/glycine betaine transport system substrate-binding protein
MSSSAVAQRKRLNPIISRTARISKDVAEMLDLYAVEQDWSANTALDNVLRKYLEGLGYKEKLIEAKKNQETAEDSDS